MYKILVGIQDDNLQERYEPGMTADLSRWPTEIIEEFERLGYIEKVKINGKRKGR